MIVMKDCPNCGSFDITDRQQRHGIDGRFLCNACGADWEEGMLPNHASVDDFDADDRGFSGNPDLSEVQGY